MNECRAALGGIFSRLARMERTDHARFVGHLYLTWASRTWEPVAAHDEAAMEFDFWKMVRQHDLSPDDALNMIQEAALKL